MKNLLKHIAISCFLFMSAALFLQSKKIVKCIIEIGKTDNQSMNHLDVLANRFGGRLIKKRLL